jgi:hypothetical protein
VRWRASLAQNLSGKRRSDQTHAGNIATGVIKTRNEAGVDGISSANEHNWNSCLAQAILSLTG